METELERVRTDDGETLFLDRSDADRGGKGPFYAVYVDADKEARWGYFCDNCGSLDNAMDTMGRIECNVCGNIRKPDEWDAAHE
ncbi:hypothetical protein SAMN04488063_1942 [Halopelagius inordinatus]|uniref:GNAT family acetyltransferase n=1 Tax=Halopelagius inordinatus TaxID=553467 RepID=A0A1I2RMK5_9EURY|nr:DUF5816 domain-containing protein [Halopelagius inordinatus]SFG40709.1 hypothetical protein SAMN04488063_1942 [Halopelagius inordinatus]